jgi:hypothetical protein
MNFIKLTSAIHDDPENNRVVISPWEIAAICPRKGAGATIVTKQNYTYKVTETVEQIEDAIFKLKEQLRTPWKNDPSSDE